MGNPALGCVDCISNISNGEVVIMGQVLAYKVSEHLPTLADRAMLVNLKIGTWDGFAYSKEATIDGFGSTDLGRSNKALLKHSGQFKKTKAAFGAVRSYVNTNTVPWKDNGVRLLPSTQYLEFTQGLAQVKALAEHELVTLANIYDTEIQNDKFRFDSEAIKSGKTSLFNYMDYPADIAAKFYIKCGFEPIPSSKDFRVTLSDADMKDLDDAVLEAQSAVTNHLLEEMAKPMRQLAEHLAKPVDDIKRFHESVVTNVHDTALRLQKLNINDDPNIAKIIKEVKDELRVYTAYPETLKENQSARDEARAKLNAMMANMGIA